MKTFKIVTHAHSNWSYDGSWPISKLAKTVSNWGGDVLMMTEHSQRFRKDDIADFFAECEAASTDRFRVIPGIEYSSPKNEIHILTWGLQDYLDEELPVTDILRGVKDRGGLAIFAHPSRRNVWQKFDPAWLPDLYGIEVWNRKSDGLAPSPHAQELIATHKIQPIASLDFHQANQFYPLYNTLRSDLDIHQLTNDDIVSLIGRSTMEPRFLGLPADGMSTPLARATGTACSQLNLLLKLLRSARRKFSS